MKKQLLIILFSLLPIAFLNIKAQTNRELTNLSSLQKGDDNSVSIFPNPTKDLLSIKVKDTSLKIKTVTLYSILGMPVASYSINMNSAEISIEKLRPGKYLMKYTLSDNSTKIKQIIKQ